MTEEPEHHELSEEDIETLEEMAKRYRSAGGIARLLWTSLLVVSGGLVALNIIIEKWKFWGAAAK